MPATSRCSLATDPCTSKQTIERFYALDGTCFNTEAECARYEKGLEQYTALDKAFSLPHFSYIIPFGGLDCYEDHRWILVNNPDELMAIKTGLFYDADSIAADFTPDSFPCWVCTIYDDYGDGYIETLETLQEQFELFLKEVRKKQEVSEHA